MLVLRENDAIFKEEKKVFYQGQSGLLVSVPQKLDDLPSGQLQSNFGKFSTLARVLAENVKRAFTANMNLCNPPGSGETGAECLCMTHNSQIIVESSMWKKGLYRALGAMQ